MTGASPVVGVQTSHVRHGVTQELLDTVMAAFHITTSCSSRTRWLRVTPPDRTSPSTKPALSQVLTASLSYVSATHAFKVGVQNRYGCSVGWVCQ